ncbi:SAM-dependent methyltransferase [Actinoplanes sp. CA-142083]|uniref:SAM-dependent methyltransferase n=1 Tax=Actinoplanes sp. CA-142083 TaxID=3239903 RepID=UPI003D94FB34
MIDTTVAHPARRYNYWLGGEHHFEADRASGDAIEAAMPTIRLMAVENRRFLGRAARYVAAQGVRQFLDIGTGIPAPGGVAGNVPAEARVVFVDNDPLVQEHSAALRGEGRAYIEADLRSPAAILDHPALKATLDLGEPVGLMLAAVLHFIRDDEDPQGIVRTLIGALAPGSYVAASHATWEYVSPAAVAQLTAQNPGGRFVPRDGAEFAAFFAGHELVEPGLASVAHWHAGDEPQPRPAIEDVACNGLVARRA